jgi:hypothetical protein
MAHVSVAAKTKEQTGDSGKLLYFLSAIKIIVFD